MSIILPLYGMRFKNVMFFISRNSCHLFTACSLLLDVFVYVRVLKALRCSDALRITNNDILDYTSMQMEVNSNEILGSTGINNIGSC